MKEDGNEEDHENYGGCNGYRGILATLFSGITIATEMNMNTCDHVKLQVDTCQADGNHAYFECIKCGTYFDGSGAVINDIPARHTPGDWEYGTYVPPTYVSPGSHAKVRYCTVCHEKLDEEIMEIEPSGSYHHPEQVPFRDSTCETPGNVEHYVCADCGGMFLTDLIPVTEEEIRIPVKEHTAGAEVRENETEASCDSKGSYDLVVYCEICGKELSRKMVQTEEKEHVPGEAVIENEVPATSTEGGHKDVVEYCRDCGTELKREKQIIEHT